jgi:hypothetical protein
MSVTTNQSDDLSASPRVSPANAKSHLAGRVVSKEGEIRQMANEVAARMQKRARRLHYEYLEAQALAEAKKAEIVLANLAVDRAASFQPEIGGQFQCPLCWIEKGIKSAFRAVPCATRRDAFQCQHGHDYTITY